MWCACSFALGGGGLTADSTGACELAGEAFQGGWEFGVGILVLVCVFW